MGEVVNVLVAFAVIVFLFRWATSSTDSNERSAADTLGFRPKPVTQDMIDTISNMFPDIPVDNVRYDLMRTGSVELTSNKILERGFLDAPPPAYYTLFPRNTTATNANGRPGAPTPAHGGPGSANSSSDVEKLKETLISRYNLQDRIVTEPPIPDESVGGKAKWEITAEEREASLKERKARMILAARQRMLAQQQQETSAASS